MPCRLKTTHVIELLHSPDVSLLDQVPEFLFDFLDAGFEFLNPLVTLTTGCYRGKPLSLTLPSVPTLTDRLIKSGSGLFIWTADLSCSYRQLCVCVLSLPLLGLSANDQFFIDLPPPFGCRMRKNHSCRGVVA